MESICIVIKALKDGTLDFNCKGIIAYLAFCAKDQRSFTDELARVSGSGSMVIKRSFSTLENKGYIERKSGNNADRRIVWYKLKRSA